MAVGISLANKCQLLFGCAVLLILAAALSVPWFRTPMIVHESQMEAARELADAWLSDMFRLGAFDETDPIVLDEDAEQVLTPGLRMQFITYDEYAAGLTPGSVERDEDDETDEPAVDAFISRAFDQFQADPARREHFASTQADGAVVYRYARAIRQEQFEAISDQLPVDIPDTPAADHPDSANPLRAVLVVDRSDTFAQGQLLRNRMYIIAAGLAAGLVAVLVFYFILTKLILSPVRSLRDTVGKVQQGDLAIRSEIRTGDEFEQLSEAFNAMLDQVEQSQSKLRSINESLDLKLNELSEANVGLYESNRLKSEFLANVSHELRTPLNSIIGFAELLHEMAQSDPEADPKRQRYLANILSSGRSLQEMIQELLQMARIEAGRVEVNVEPTSIADIVEGLVAIMKPQAETKQVELRSQVAQNLPLVETDPGKLQQILYNFMSNAIKFTPEHGTVTISADRVKRQDNSVGVRLGVSDTGPGIPYDMQETIFEKFRQIDASHTREHSGTGLGLAICRELAELLGATVSLVSEPGRGATFFVDLPLMHQTDQARPLMEHARSEQ